MLNWLETNVPALRHVVVANPGGRRWLELWNMAITKKAEDYYRIVNNLLDNSGGGQDDAMSSAALNMGYLLWKLTQVVDEDLEWRSKNQEQYSPPAHLEPAQHTGPLLKCGEKATKPDWGRATRLGPFETEDQAGIPPASRKTTGGGSSSAARTKEISNCTTAGCGIATIARTAKQLTGRTTTRTAAGTGRRPAMTLTRTPLRYDFRTGAGMSFRTASTRDGALSWTSPSTQARCQAVSAMSSSALRTTMRRRESCCRRWRKSKGDPNTSCPKHVRLCPSLPVL